MHVLASRTISVGCVAIAERESPAPISNHPYKNLTRASPRTGHPPLAKASMKSPVHSVSSCCFSTKPSSSACISKRYAVFKIYIYINICKTVKANLKLGEKLRGANVSGTTGSACRIKNAAIPNSMLMW